MKIYSTDITDFFVSPIDFSEFDFDALPFLRVLLIRNMRDYVHSFINHIFKKSEHGKSSPCCLWPCIPF